MKYTDKRNLKFNMIEEDGEKKLIAIIPTSKILKSEQKLLNFLFNKNKK
jgi:hypothetical protein